MFESEKMHEFVLHISKRGFVTKKSQDFFGSMGYYMAIWNLRDAGMIKEDGFDESNQKIWKLTPNGNKLAEYFRQMQEIQKNLDKLVNREVLE
jgi:hypothetical protein